MIEVLTDLDSEKVIASPQGSHPEEVMQPATLPFECRTCGARWDFLQAHYAEDCVAQQLTNAKIDIARARMEARHRRDLETATKEWL